MCNLLTENNQHVVLTEEQKGHKFLINMITQITQKLFFLVILVTRGEMEVIIPA